MTIFFDKIKSHRQKELPFVVYRKPNSDTIAGFFQNDDSLNFANDFSEQGFIFAPFDAKNKTVLIPKNRSEFIHQKLELNDEFLSNFNNNSVIPDAENHINLVEKSIKNIEKKVFQKVVVSRQETVELSNFNLIETYQKLLLKYPNTLVYAWFHSKIGLWMGATPETLLSISKNDFETMSLAGTQVYDGNLNAEWGNKEIEEQALVTDFIKNQLQPICTSLKIEKTNITKVGNLLHLKTGIKGMFNSEKYSLKKLINALHPTPAVCGFPRENTKKFILENENYKRTFYTGFLGELNLNNQKSVLFVNLRCMEIDQKTANIYVGGGITKDSNPKKEWEETVSKAKIMKSVL